jgi:multidrug transporter EmrE-like cation transporter
MDLIYWYVIATLVALIPIYLIKQYVISSNLLYLLIAMVLYIILMISYIKIFEHDQVASSYTILQITQIVAVVIMGLLFFDEKITTNKTIGLCFGLTSVYLLT